MFGERPSADIYAPPASRCDHRVDGDGVDRPKPANEVITDSGAESVTIPRFSLYLIVELN